MTKPPLPTVIEHHSEPSCATWLMQIDAEHPAFAGHFPEHPIVPGVVQLDWAVSLGCAHFGYSAAVAQIEVLKFQQLILPNTQFTLTINHDAAKRKLLFSVTAGERRFASGRILLSEGANG
ncbi:thioester dehydrase [Shewanella avicenniae]|uniref:Thioester dehydrase n=1 Tax=Shewanella avicenniae TaxID=2814294 RepID=A0ABX7QSF4_9GAMM|nr:thioester dehydrase [Shewanella avicenniae]QSX33925.1 thioester dehydrase [Shewanella avicenniae]